MPRPSADGWASQISPSSAFNSCSGGTISTPAFRGCSGRFPTCKPLQVEDVQGPRLLPPCEIPRSALRCHIPARWRGSTRSRPRGCSQLGRGLTSSILFRSLCSLGSASSFSPPVRGYPASGFRRNRSQIANLPGGKMGVGGKMAIFWVLS